MRCHESYSECMRRDRFKIAILSRILFGFVVTSTISCVTLAQSSAKPSSAGVPVYKITPVVSKIDFGVKASVSIEGTFDKWNATLVFKAPDVSTGVLDVKIQADSVNTGSGLKTTS